MTFAEAIDKGQGKSGKLVENEKVRDFMKRAPQVPKGSPYMVFMDGNGVPYLRVSTKPLQFVVYSGTNGVELIQMDENTFQKKALTAIPAASILAAGNILRRPLSTSVKISKRAEEALDKLLNDEEIKNMAEAGKKKAKKAPAAPKAAAAGKEKATKAAKAAKPNGAPRASTEEMLKKRFEIAEKVLKGEKGKMSLKDFNKAMEGKYPSPNATRAKLISAGMLKFDAKEKTISLK